MTDDTLDRLAGDGERFATLNRGVSFLHVPGGDAIAAAGGAAA